MNNKKKLGAVIGGIAVVGAAVALTAGTFSYFSDSQTTAAGGATTGTLTLNLGVNQNGTAGAINATNIAPGWTQTESFTVTNTGSLDGEAWISLKEAGKSSKALENAMNIDAMGRSVPVSTAVGMSRNGIDMGKLAAGKSKTYTITFVLPSTAGNDVQGQSLALQIQTDLEQITNGAPGVVPAAQ
jgi:predicted ribosomally synthesized peptide with SipW-like signal peptide